MFSIHTKLSATAKILFVFILVLLAFNPMLAKVIHRQIDTTVSVTIPPDQYMLAIDMNNDGMEDFAIAHNNPSGNDQYVDIFADQSGDIYINEDHEVIPLEKDFSISKETTKWNTPTGTGLIFRDNWFGKGALFIGVRFKIGSYFHYGWIRLSIPDDVSSFTLIDLAYEDTPSQAIKAGDDGATGIIESRPESSPVLEYSNHIININAHTGDLSKYIIDVFDITGNKILFFNNLYENKGSYLDLNTGIYLVILREGCRVIDSMAILDID